MDRNSELVKRLQDGETQAKDILVEENMKLIWGVVHKFKNRGHDVEDLFQIGAVGLLKCIDRFDLSFNVKFSTYAFAMIIGEIRRFLREDNTMHIPRPLIELSEKAMCVQEILTNRHGKDPKITELASELDVNIKEVELALSSRMNVESLQREDTPFYLIDKQGSNNNMMENLALKEVIRKLKPIEQKIIMMRYFYGKYQSEVAKEIGISQAHVCRVEKKVLKIMRYDGGL